MFAAESFICWEPLEVSTLAKYMFILALLLVATSGMSPFCQENQ
jgi:hypothetical protein